jgi:CheY-like chemotaxis protein
MTTILIADSCKPSLVMSSEVFKDKISGSFILVAKSGAECLEVLQQHKPDMCVVDFDLPDTDGVTLIAAMRKYYRGPILLTAFPDTVVENAVNADLFAFNDAGAWISKPIKFDVLSAKIDQFLLDKHRLGKRFDCDLTTLLVGKGAGRGKRAPKVNGHVLNLSLGGLCIKLDGPMKMKGGDEMTINMDLPQVTNPLRARTKTTAAKKKTPGSRRRRKVAEAKLRVKVAWIDRKSHTAGLAFSRLTDLQRKGLETLMRDATD